MRLATPQVVSFLGLILAVACGSRSNLDLLPSTAVVSLPSLDLGTSTCGDPGTSQSITLRAGGDSNYEQLTWSASVLGPFDLIGPTSGVLEAGTGVELRVVAHLPSSAPATGAVTGTLRFLTSDLQRPQLDIPLRATAKGPTWLVPSTLDFGFVRPLDNTPYVQTITVRNTSDAALTLAATLGGGNPGFEVLDPAVTIARGATGSIGIRYTSGTSGTAKNTLHLASDDPACSSSVVDVALAAHVVNLGALVSPKDLDYGYVPCGTQAAPRMVTVTNVTEKPFGFHVTVNGGQGNFKIAPMDGQVPGKSKVEIVVTPDAIPAIVPAPLFQNGFGASFTVSTDVAADGFDYPVDATQSAYGAILTSDPWPDAGPVLVDDLVLRYQPPIKNLGNAPVTLTGSAVGMTLQPTTIAPSGEATPALAFKLDPSVNPLSVPVSTPLNVQANAPLCAPLPTFLGQARPIDRAIDASVGYYTLCAVGHSHRGYCQGNGSILPKNEPTPVVMQGVTADHVALSDQRVCFSSGTQVSCIGNGNNLPPGPVAYTLPFAPVRLVGERYDLPSPAYFGISSTGALVGFGDDYAYGFFGTGSAHNSGLVLSPFGGLVDVISASIEGHVACVVRAGGTVYCSGAVGSQIVPGASTGTAYSPLQVPGITDAVAVSVTEYGMCILRASQVSCWNRSAGGSWSHFSGVTSPEDLAAYAGNPSFGFVLESDHSVSYFDQGPSVIPLLGYSGTTALQLGTSGVVRDTQGRLTGLGVNSQPFPIAGFE